MEWYGEGDQGSQRQEINLTHDDGTPALLDAALLEKLDACGLSPEACAPRVHSVSLVRDFRGQLTALSGEERWNSTHPERSVHRCPERNQEVRDELNVLVVVFRWS